MAGEDERLRVSELPRHYLLDTNIFIYAAIDRDWDTAAKMVNNEN